MRFDRFHAAFPPRYNLMEAAFGGAFARSSLAAAALRNQAESVAAPAPAPAAPAEAPAEAGGASAPIQEPTVIKREGPVDVKEFLVQRGGGETFTYEVVRPGWRLSSSKPAGAKNALPKPETGKVVYRGEDGAPFDFLRAITLAAPCGSPEAAVPFFYHASAKPLPPIADTTLRAIWPKTGEKSITYEAAGKEYVYEWRAPVRKPPAARPAAEEPTAPVVSPPAARATGEKRPAAEVSPRADSADYMFLREPDAHADHPDVHPIGVATSAVQKAYARLKRATDALDGEMADSLKRIKRCQEEKDEALAEVLRGMDNINKKSTAVVETLIEGAERSRRL